MTFVTVGELTQWVELRQWGRRNRDALENWLGGVIILPYNEDVGPVMGTDLRCRDPARTGKASE